VRPLFTIHAGEYLVASEIERRFGRTNVWVPSRDTGVDLLVTDRVEFLRDVVTEHQRANQVMFALA